MIATRTIAATIAVTLSLAFIGSAADWPYWRGPLLTGVSAETDWQFDWPETGPTILWEAQIGIGFSSMTVADGRAYTMGNVGKDETEKDVVTCLDALSGKTLWTHTYAEDLHPKYYEGGPSATPTIHDGKVYTLSRSGKLFCLDAKTGDVAWTQDLVAAHGIVSPEWGLASSVLVHDGVLYLNVGNAGMALKAEDGSLVWKSGKKTAGYASLVPYDRDGQKHLLVFSGTELLSVVAATGEPVWRHRWKTNWKVNAADPLVIGDHVFVSSGYGTGCGLFKLEGDTATEVYRNKDMKNQCYGSVLYGDFVYGFSGKVNAKNAELVCMDPVSGQVQWRQKGLGLGTLIVAGDKLIILGERGKLVIAKAQADAYEELASAQVLKGKCWTVPTLANGLLYARNAAGRLVCMDVR